ncbi:hypothetical protein ABZ863_26105 [Saccharomonospora sp. NPDC046836]|uniref:hypothetical protein n=1 Tax=Saccharomonospora sp. NPDC046836 TaxID=3156921 RepID=UPI0033C70CBB
MTAAPWSSPAPYVEEFLTLLSEAFLTLFDLPRPVVAAVNGHAIAGGGVLAAAFAQTKYQLHRPFNERIGEQRAADDPRAGELWTAPEPCAPLTPTSSRCWPESEFSFNAC